MIYIKFYTYAGLVEQRRLIAHFLLREEDLAIVEFSSREDEFLMSVDHSGMRDVVRVAFCVSKSTG